MKYYHNHLSIPLIYRVLLRYYSRNETTRVNLPVVFLGRSALNANYRLSDSKNIFFFFLIIYSLMKKNSVSMKPFENVECVAIKSYLYYIIRLVLGNRPGIYV